MKSIYWPMFHAIPTIRGKLSAQPIYLLSGRDENVADKSSSAKHFYRNTVGDFQWP